MNKVFRVELFGGKTDRWCDLELPASYYGLQDALDKLQMPLGDKPRWEFLEHHGFQFLHVHLTHECDLYQLNALATCLGQMNGREKTAFEGLFNMEVSKKYGPISVATMIDLAYSTDCCHVINATTDEQLGRFYAENDFIPALEKVPDSIFEYLDFEMLGRKARFEEGGVFASGGYVTQHTELKQVYGSLALIPEAPQYGIRLTVGSFLENFANSLGYTDVSGSASHAGTAGCRAEGLRRHLLVGNGLPGGGQCDACASGKHRLRRYP